MSGYVDWLAGRLQADGRCASRRRGDFAARDFKRHLKLERRWAPSSVNLALAAIDHFNRFLGLGWAVVSREQVAPRALDEDEQRALLRAAERAAPRDQAIVVVLLHTAVRLSELVAVDVDDVRISARKGLVIVRSGKGDAHREIPLNPTARGALEAWLMARAKLAAEGERALFVGRKGRRLTARAIDLVVRKVAGRAGLELSAHVMRHTCITKLVRAGNDVGASGRAGRPPAAGDHAPLQPALARRPPARHGRPGGGGLMARAILTDAERLAWERFPTEPDPDVIGAFFTLAEGEVDALRRLPTPAAQLASAVALGAASAAGVRASRARPGAHGGRRAPRRPARRRPGRARRLLAG